MNVSTSTNPNSEAESRETTYLSSKMKLIEQSGSFKERLRTNLARNYSGENIKLDCKETKLFTFEKKNLANLTNMDSHKKGKVTQIYAGSEISDELNLKPQSKFRVLR